MKWKLEIKMTGSHEPEIYRSNISLYPHHPASLIEDYRQLVYRSIIDGETKGRLTDQTGWIVEYDGDIPFEDLSKLNKEKILFNVLYCYRTNGEV